MSSHKFTLVALILGVGLISASICNTANAAPGMRGGRSRPMNSNNKDAKPTPEPQHTTISLISGNSITISTGKETKTYTIDQDTQIQLKGGRATVADLKPGMRVAITPGIAPALAGVILASDAPKAPPATTKPKGKK